nr:cytochrome b [uncultured Rhodopila sp.]
MASTAVSAPQTSYTLPAKFYHWTTAVLIAAMFVTIWLRGFMESKSPAQAFWTNAHTSLGILVFGLTLVRLLSRPHAPESGESAFAEFLRTAMHRTLLVVTLLLPISGFVRMSARNRVTDFFGYAIASPFGDAPSIYAIGRALHGDAMQYVVLALIGLHVVAALGHHYVLKDDTLRRMV